MIEELQRQLAALQAQIAQPAPVPAPAALPSTVVGRIAEEIATLRAVLSPYNNRIRAGLFAVAAALLAGSPPPFDKLAVALGGAGWFGAGIMGVLALCLKSTPTITQLTSAASDSELVALRRAVNCAVAKAGGGPPV
jgi:hypothetical protein